MNVVKLLGHFCTIKVSERGGKIDNTYEWQCEDGFYSATFLTCDGTWIEVRVKTDYFDYWYSHYCKGFELVQIEGRLCSEILEGITKHYISIW